MSRREELAILVSEASANGMPLEAEAVVEAAKDKQRFPRLHEHLWEVSEEKLAAEGRIARAHRLIITLHVVSQDGTVTRMMVHTIGTKGYQSVSKVVGSIDLATIKLTELMADVSRARARLSAFRAFIPDETSDEIDEALKNAERSIARVTAQEAAA